MRIRPKVVQEVNVGTAIPIQLCFTPNLKVYWVWGEAKNQPLVTKAEMFYIVTLTYQNKKVVYCGILKCNFCTEEDTNSNVQCLTFEQLACPGNCWLAGEVEYHQQGKFPGLLLSPSPALAQAHSILIFPSIFCNVVLLNLPFVNVNGCIVYLQTFWL